MKSQQKQSQKIGGLVTREIHLGADGPISVKLSDNIIFDTGSGVVTVPATRILEVLQQQSKPQCQYKQQFADLQKQVQDLSLLVSIIIQSTAYQKCDSCGSQPSDESTTAENILVEQQSAIDFPHEADKTLVEQQQTQEVVQDRANTISDPVEEQQQTTVQIVQPVEHLVMQLEKAEAPKTEQKKQVVIQLEKPKQRGRKRLTEQ